MKLKVKDISKNYNRYSALRGVNLELEPGLYGLLGPNGAGKSTLLKIIAGILRPTAGSILLDNEPVSKLGEHYRAMLGYMPQDLGIYPEFTAKRYLLYIAALKGLTEAQAKAEIDKLLEAVGLSSNAEQKLKGFSGGMLRRVGIAQTLLCNPQILLLDEPTENQLVAARAKKMAIEAEKLTGDNIYKVLIYFDKLYSVMDDQEKRQLMESLLSEVQIYEERQPNGQWLKSIKFKLPIIAEDMSLSLDNDAHMETVVRLERCV